MCLVVLSPSPRFAFRHTPAKRIEGRHICSTRPHSPASWAASCHMSMPPSSRAGAHILTGESRGPSCGEDMRVLKLSPISHRSSQESTTGPAPSGALMCCCAFSPDDARPSSAQPRDAKRRRPNFQSDGRLDGEIVRRFRGALPQSTRAEGYSFAAESTP